MLSHLLREAVLPPGSLLILFVIGLLLRTRKPRISLAVITSSVVLLYLLSIPLVSFPLSRMSERLPPVEITEIKAFAPKAIVVLGGGAESKVTEYQGKTVPTETSLKRIVYAAFLEKETGLPILVTGGYGDSVEESEGWAMRDALQSFGTPVRWMEAQGKNTKENALFSQTLLKKDGVNRILLVTSASHAGRARRTFEKAGFEVLAAPTGFRVLSPWERGVMQVVPSGRQFFESSQALRELFSSVFYALTGS